MLGGPADGLRALPARLQQTSGFGIFPAPKTPGHVPVIRGLKIHTLLGGRHWKYRGKSTFLIFAKLPFREKL